MLHPLRAALIAFALCAASLAGSATVAQAAAPPTLNSPLSSTSVGGQIEVDYSLPATPDAHSVTVTFAGAATTTLTLASTATTGDFTFAAASPGSAPAVESVTGPAIADGTYSVTLAYESSVDSTTASITSTNVVVDTETAAPTLLAPVNGGDYSSIPIRYTLPQTAQAGSVRVTFSGPVTRTLTMINTSVSTTAYVDPTNPAGTAPVVSITPAASTLPDGSYTMVLSYSNSLGDPQASAGPISIQIDHTTLQPTLTEPASGTVSGPLTVNYSLPEAAEAGTVTLKFAGPVTRTLTMVDSSPSGAFSLNPQNPTASPDVVSISPSATTIPDGTYTVTISYQDALGNLAAASSVSAVTLDNATLAPILTQPAAGASITGPISVSYSLPETATAGSVTLTLTGPKTYALTLADSAAGTHSLTIDPANPGSSADVANVSGGATIAPGTYSFALSYQDALGNPAASSAAAAITLEAASALVPPATSTPTASTPTPSTVLAPVTGVGSLSGPLRVRHSCRLPRRSCVPPTFRFTASAPETVVLRFAGKHGRNELTVTVSVSSSGPSKVRLTRSQWRRLRRGRTTVVASAGTSASRFGFRVR